MTEKSTKLPTLGRRQLLRAAGAGALAIAGGGLFPGSARATPETAAKVLAELLGGATGKAGRIEQKRWLIGVLDDLANQQIAYFERTLAARAIDPASFDLAEPRVEAFCAGMLDIAEKGAFLDIVVAMFAAEWMYWTWSKRVAAAAIAGIIVTVVAALCRGRTTNAVRAIVRPLLSHIGAGIGNGQARPLVPAQE